MGTCSPDLRKWRGYNISHSVSQGSGAAKMYPIFHNFHEAQNSFSVHYIAIMHTMQQKPHENGKNRVKWRLIISLYTRLLVQQFAVQQQ